MREPWNELPERLTALFGVPFQRNNEGRIELVDDGDAQKVLEHSERILDWDDLLHDLDNWAPTDQELETHQTAQEQRDWIEFWKRMREWHDKYRYRKSHD